MLVEDTLMPIYDAVIQKAKDEQLLKKLPQSNPRIVEGKGCVRIINVAPRTQDIIYLIVSDAGVQLRASNGNYQSLGVLREAVLRQPGAVAAEIHVTPIRTQASTLSRNFSVKPTNLLKRDERLRIETTYRCLKIVVEALQPFI